MSPQDFVPHCAVKTELGAPWLPHHVLQALAVPPRSAGAAGTRCPHLHATVCSSSAVPAPSPLRLPPCQGALLTAPSAAGGAEPRRATTPVLQPCPLPGTTRPTWLSHSQTSLETAQAAPQGKVSQSGLLWQGCISGERGAWPARSLFPPPPSKKLLLYKNTNYQHHAVLGSGQWGLRQCCLRTGRVLTGAFHHRWVYGILLASRPPALAPAFYY